MRVLELVAQNLRQLGADGLCNGECGCGLGDLAPCREWIGDCVPEDNQRRSKMSHRHDLIVKWDKHPRLGDCVFYLDGYIHFTEYDHMKDLLADPGFPVTWCDLYGPNGWCKMTKDGIEPSQKEQK